MTTAFMYDDVNVPLIPSNAAVVAYYTDGTYANGTAIRQHCPSATLVSIAVRAADDAESLDVEPGDATVYDAAAWVRRQIARGVHLPVIYCSAGVMDTLVSVMAANGLVFGVHYRIWSAHYTGAAHICGSCGYRAAHWTQYTDTAHGYSLDESELPGIHSFTAAPAPVVATEAFPYKLGMKDVVATGGPIWTIQRGLNKWSTEIKLPKLLVTDGSFGPLTAAAVKLALEYWKYSVANVALDEVDQSLWTHLLANPPAVPATTYGAVTNLKVVLPGFTSLSLSWSEPVGASLIGTPQYQVYLYDNGNAAPSLKNIVPSYPRIVTTPSALLGNLKENTEYTVHVVAAGPNGSHIRPYTYATVQGQLKTTVNWV